MNSLLFLLISWIDFSLYLMGNAHENAISVVLCIKLTTRIMFVFLSALLDGFYPKFRLA